MSHASANTLSKLDGTNKELPLPRRRTAHRSNAGAAWRCDAMMTALRSNGSRTARWCKCFTRNDIAVGCSWSTNVIVNSGELQTIDGSMLLLDKLCLVPMAAKYIFVVLPSSPYNSAYWTVGSLTKAPQKVIMHALLEINGFHVSHLTKTPSAFSGLLPTPQLYKRGLQGKMIYPTW